MQEKTIPTAVGPRSTGGRAGKTFRASWRNTSGLGVLCIVLSFLFISGGAVVRTPLLVVLGALPLAYMYAIGRRHSAYIDDERIVYHDWLKSNDVEWTSIESVILTDDLPYPRNRIHGPATYEVRTPERRFMVNLLYFPPEFATAFLGAIKQRHLLRRKRDSR